MIDLPLLLACQPLCAAAHLPPAAAAAGLTCQQGYRLDAATGDCVACTAADQTTASCATFDTNTCSCAMCKRGFGPLAGDAGNKKCPICADPTPVECSSYAATDAAGPGSKGTCSCAMCATAFSLDTPTGDCVAVSKLQNACRGRGRREGVPPRATPRAALPTAPPPSCPSALPCRSALVIRC